MDLHEQSMSILEDHFKNNNVRKIWNYSISKPSSWWTRRVTKSEQGSTTSPGSNYNLVFLCGHWEPGPWCLQAHHHYGPDSTGGSTLCVPSHHLYHLLQDDVSAQVAFLAAFYLHLSNWPRKNFLNDMETTHIYWSLLKIVTG